MALLDELAAYLATVSPSLGLIVKGSMPATSDVCLSLQEYGGAPPTTGFGTPGLQYEMPGVQILARGVAHDYQEPRARIERAYQALAKVQGTTLSGTKYLMVRPQQSPFLLERDGNERCVFAVNCLAEKEPSAAA